MIVFGAKLGTHGFPFRFPLTFPKMIFCSKKPCQIQGFSRRSTESGGGRLHIKLIASEQGFCRIAGQELSSRASQDQTFQKRAGDVERMKSRMSCLLQKKHHIYDKSTAYKVIFKNSLKRRGNILLRNFGIDP